MGARQGFLPLPIFAQHEDGPAFAIDRETNALLQLMAALPAEIARHGWPRKLSLPAFAQLASYSSDAHYTPHLDRWDHEEHNRREITILVYANVGWDARKSGGCLRLHPEEQDIEPTAGRLVLFQSGSKVHEVRRCTDARAERLALTLWVEFAPPS